MKKGKIAATLLILGAICALRLVDTGSMTTDERKVTQGGEVTEWAREEGVLSGDESVVTPTVFGQSAPSFTKIRNVDLNQAFQEARHLVTEVTEEEQQFRGNEGVRYFANLPGQGMTARFGEGNVLLLPSVDGPEWKLSLEVAGSPEQSGNNEVSYRDGEVTQWFRSSVKGLEQGWILDEAPEGGEDGRVELEVAIGGTLKAGFDVESPGDLVFVDEGGGERLAYQKLRVWDSEGKVLQAEMMPSEAGYLISFVDEGATYPVTVDPIFTHVSHHFLVELGEGPIFQDVDRPPSDTFGSDLAIGDEWAFVANRYDDDVVSTNSGAVYVFRRNRSGWVFSQRIKPDDGGDDENFGEVLQYVGETLYVSGTGVGSGEGYVAGFELQDGGWLEVERIIPFEEPGFITNGFGNNFTVSNGYAAVQLNSYPSGQTGSQLVEVYRKVAGQWGKIASLCPPDADCFVLGSGDNLGGAMAFADGGRLLVGAPNHDLKGDGSTLADVGAVYAYTCSGDTVAFDEKISPPNSVTDAFLNFGRCIVTAAEDKAYVSASGYHRPTGTGADQGIVYSLRGSREWKIEDSIEAPGGSLSNDGHRFGTSMALGGGDLFVGESAGIGGTIHAYDVSGKSPTYREEISSSALAGNGVRWVGGPMAASASAFVTTLSYWPSTGPQDEYGTDNGVCFFGLADNTWRTEGVIRPYYGGGDSNLGMNMELEKDTVVMSAHADATPAGNSSGQVHIFERVGGVWNLEASLRTARHPGGSSVARYLFGSAMSLDGNGLVVASSVFGSAGAIVEYFYRNNGAWLRGQEAFRNDSDWGDHFGKSLSLRGNLLAVGAPRDRRDESDKEGSVSLFNVNRSSGVVTSDKIIWLDQGDDGDEFGQAVALLEKSVLIGAPSVNGDRGAVFRFDTKSGEGPLQIMVASDGAPGDEFGDQIEADEATCLVSASRALLVGSNRGAAYLFDSERSGETEELQRIQTPRPSEAQNNAFSIGLSGGRAAIGYSRHNRKVRLPGVFLTTTPGMVFVFERQGRSWDLESELDHPGRTSAAYFGRSLALSDDELLVSTSSDRILLPTGDGIESGSVYFFQLGSSRELFDKWAKAQGLTGANASPEASPFPVVNLADYAFGLSQSAYDSQFPIDPNLSRLPYSRSITPGPGPWEATLRVSMLVRKNAGISVQPQWSLNLGAGSWENFSSSPEISFHDFNFNRVIYEEVIFALSAAYMRVRVDME